VQQHTGTQGHQTLSEPRRAGVRGVLV
jgi:hypothetical protein